MKDVILLNNLFSGEYIEDKIGGEIINMYQSDNNKYYVYVNPYGNINKKWDNRVKYILFIRSVGNGVVKIIGKAEVKEQVSINAVRRVNLGIDDFQKKYIDKNKISYGNVNVYELGSWSNFFVTFETKGTYKAKEDIYLAVENNQNLSFENIFILKEIKKINNQSQKLYIESSNVNYHEIIDNIICNSSFWEDDTVSKVSFSKDKKVTEGFLSIIKKENDELVNSNLLAYFLENNREFWSMFVEKVLEINDKDIINGIPKITRESIGNIDLLIEVRDSVIVIENKIKSTINGRKSNGYSQLEKYVRITEKKFINQNYKLYFYVLRPNYNNENYMAFNEGYRYKEIKYSKVYDIMKDIKVFGPYFEEFKMVVKKHSAEYDNELFELMDDRFIKKIKEKQ